MPQRFTPHSVFVKGVRRLFFISRPFYILPAVYFCYLYNPIFLMYSATGASTKRLSGLPAAVA